ncbi:pentatricopeptide repeat-containing protein At3g16610-like [Magnolia sinica]|uniref:pentatricopeptide repeat-containing protein At3g16610-like n=1 Tax=Magnolia sinica TaxID=86752 RepID=UPI002659236E|nr:pentatricopeptide repeat-containing protein At3g16610-like [Magnolia sinica]
MAGTSIHLSTAAYIPSSAIPDFKTPKSRIQDRSNTTSCIGISTTSKYTKHSLTYISSSKESQHNNDAVLADSLASALQQCAAALSLREGTQIHARILYLGLASDVYLCSQLLYFYCCCRCPDAARSIFDAVSQSHHNLFFYNVMLRAYVDTARHEDALLLFSQMLASGFYPNRFSFPFVLKACSVLGCLRDARAIHGMLVVAGLQHDVFAASALLDVYFKCGCLEDACKVFDRIPHRSVVTWNSLISALARNGLWQHALDVMDFVGDQIGVCSWNSLIAGCVCHGDGELALEMLGLMLVSPSSVKPNSATFNTLLPVIPTLTPLALLKEFHAFTTRQHGLMGADDCIGQERLLSAVTAGYAYNGSMVSALKSFELIGSKSPQLWNSIIAGFVNCGQPQEAFNVFHLMAMQQGCQLEAIPKVSLTLLLSECSPSSSSGLEIHAHVCRTGLDSDTSVNNALIAMYARRGNIELSERVFTRMADKDVVSWNTMFSSYALNHDFDQAFKIFHQMHRGDVKPDEFTLASILSGCGHSAALRQGMGIHGCMVRSGFSINYCVVQNALMDMYGKCGCVEEAEKVFDEMELKDIISWNTMISCYGINARPCEAFLLFEEMQERGWQPTRVTFIALLSACSHAGLVDEGLRCFETMSSKHGISPDIEHYACIVDSLGRAGHLDVAYRLIKSMPMEPDDCIWGALLSSCRIHRNVVLAEVAARHLIELEPHHSGYRVLLSNVYADAKRWDDVAQVRAGMKDDGVKKCPGCSWIDVGGELHTFYTEDKSHKQWTAIDLTLDGLTEQLKAEGYIPTIESKFISLDQVKMPRFM